MKQYAIGFISAIMLFLVVIVSAGFAPAPNFGAKKIQRQKSAFDYK
jgi:hypothetical protein